MIKLKQFKEEIVWHWNWNVVNLVNGMGQHTIEIRYWLGQTLDRSMPKFECKMSLARCSIHYVNDEGWSERTFAKSLKLALELIEDYCKW